LKIIERVLHEIDSNPAADETVFVYRLKNAQSLNVEAVMNMLFNGTSGGGTRTTPNLSNARTTPTNYNQRGGGSGGPGNSNPFGGGSSGGLGSNFSNRTAGSAFGGGQGGSNAGGYGQTNRGGGGGGLGGLSSSS